MAERTPLEGLPPEGFEKRHYRDDSNRLLNPLNELPQRYPPARYYPN
jgi:hypothetical protein